MSFVVEVEITRETQNFSSVEIYNLLKGRKPADIKASASVL